ncbi:MAG: hypothetical protein SFV15_17720 [Polyangiaceae bacterium]|nr:hypothetical protein [Polyangiaceae bacterium]
MNKRELVFSGFGAGLLLIGSTSSAFACGACECPTLASSELVSLIRSVPLNLDLALLVHPGELSPPRLERVSDQSVIATAELDGASARLWRLKPSADLASNTEYRIMRKDGVVAQFTTGTSRDESAPTLQGVSASPGGNAALCSASIGAGLTLVGVADGESNEVWVELELQLPHGPTNIFSPYVYGQPLRVGQTAMGCFGTNEVAGLTDAQSFPTRVRVHDAAGHTSEWRTVSVSVAAEKPEGCGSNAPVLAQGGASGSSTDGISTPDPSEGDNASCAVNTLARHSDIRFGVWGALSAALWALFARRGRK